MPQVTAYKVDTLEGVKPDSIVALKVPNENKFELWVTSRTGVPYPLSTTGTLGGINSIINTDGELEISGSSIITINISDTLLATINSALQAGDNISSLVNDAGYLTTATLISNTSELTNDGEDGTSTYVETKDLGAVAFSNSYNDLDNLPTVGTGSTNLGYTASPTNGIVTSDTGNDATIPLAGVTNAGLFTAAEKTKLAGIQTAATANSSDATLLNRANHTGTQLASTISDFETAVNDLIEEVDTSFLNVAYSASVLHTYNELRPNIEIDITGNFSLTIIGTTNGDSGLVNLYFSSTQTATLNGFTNLIITGSGTMIPVYFIHDSDGLKWYQDEKGRVPYTGANQNVDLGEYQLKAGQVELDQTPTGSFGVGKIRWNDTAGTAEIRLKGNNVTLQLGQELVKRVVNKTVTNITLLEADYQVVKIIGATGQRLSVDLAQANNDLNSATTLGIVTENISNNQEGFITYSGEVNLINTTGSLQGETWTDGDILYLSPTTAGAITNIKPTAPNHTVVVGYVEYSHAVNGKIFVKVDNGYELEELHNVKITSPANKDSLVYNSSLGYWENTSVNRTLLLDKTSFTYNALTTGQQSIKDWVIPANSIPADCIIRLTIKTFRLLGSGNPFMGVQINGSTGWLNGVNGNAARRNIIINDTTYDYHHTSGIYIDDIITTENYQTFPIDRGIDNTLTLSMNCDVTGNIFKFYYIMLEIIK